MWEFNILFLMQQHIFAHFLIDFAGTTSWLSAELRLCLVQLYCISSVKGMDCLCYFLPSAFAVRLYSHTLAKKFEKSSEN